MAIAINYHYFTAFYQVATHGSLTKAAKEMNIAVSAVSRQIELFEHALAAKVFTRHPRGVELTPLGQNIFQHAKIFHSALESELKSPDQRIVKIGTLQSVFETFLLPYIQQQEPHIQQKINLEINSPADLLNDLREMKIDIAITTMNLPKEAGLDSFKLYKEKVALVAKNRPNLDLKHNPTRVIFTPLEHHWRGFPHAVNEIKINSLNASLELIKRGIGVTILPLSFVKDIKGIDYKIIEKKKSEWIYFCISKRSQQTDKERAIFKGLQSYLRHLSGE